MLCLLIQCNNKRFSCRRKARYFYKKNLRLKKTLYWNRTNIYCFEDRCTNHYTKSANKVFFILYVQVKRLELLQLLRHFILSEACLPFQHTCYCIYYCITFSKRKPKKGIRKFDIKRSWRNRDLNSDSCDANTVYYQLYYFPFISYNIIFKHKEKYATLLDFYPDT